MNVIRRVVLSIPIITRDDKWVFVEVETSSGAIGTGEATLRGKEPHIAVELRALGATLVGQPPKPDLLAKFVDPRNLPRAAIISALDQAFHDIEAQQHNVTLCAMLGQKRNHVNLYANINRRTESRSPEGFAESTLLAMMAGFRAVKIAPFDEVTTENASLDRAEAGLKRIAAVRDVLAPGMKLFVDCHWRFTPAIALEMIAPLSELGVTWYECPIVETEENIPILRRLRRAANESGMVLAGMERGIGTALFETFASGGAYDVMMPDIKYIGGVSTMMQAAELLERHGVSVSPHNPTGPICHAASLAVCGALENMGLLEHQFDETPYFWRLVDGKLETPRSGAVHLPKGSGLGVSLNKAILDELSCERIVVE